MTGSAVRATYKEIESLIADRPGAIEQLLYREARLLDRAKFEDWLRLFTADGIYWVPSRVGQTDRRYVASIVYEDVPLLAMRVQRLGHPRAHVLAPMPRTTHVVGNIEVFEIDAAKHECQVESAFLMSEYRGHDRRIFSGRYLHVLRLEGDALRIALKRVDLIDCDGIHAAMSIPF